MLSSNDCASPTVLADSQRQGSCCGVIDIRAGHLWVAAALQQAAPCVQGCRHLGGISASASAAAGMFFIMTSIAALRLNASTNAVSFST